MIDFHPTTISCYRCAASAWEAVRVRETRERGREDVVQCAFCGVMDAVPAVKVERAAVDGFRFQFGRFSGMTLAEADGEENGRAYLEHLRDTNEKLRDRIAEYLTASA